MRRLLICLLLLVPACGESGATLGTDPSDSPSVTAADPRGLLGKWTVSGAGVLPGTTLILRDSSSVDSALRIDMPCGEVGGSWAAAGDQSLFTADANSGKSGCFDEKGIKDVEWLRLPVGFRLATGGPELLGADGAVVVTLRRVGSAPAESPGAGLGKEFAEPASLPAATEPPTAQQLQRRWTPADAPQGTRAFIQFDSDRRWHGSDGCNGSGGQFVLGLQGRLLATSGPSTLIGCAGSALAYRVSQASRVGLVGDELVLYDAKAKELGRAVAG